MTNVDTLATIREYFRTVGYAGLILPSGWFGRPYDNFHQLTGLEATDESLMVELDEQLVLTFGGQPRVTATGSRLRVNGFAALAWDWTEFGSTVSHHQEFRTGEVEFVAAMG